jgi:hypothetical protein
MICKIKPYGVRHVLHGAFDCSGVVEGNYQYHVDEGTVRLAYVNKSNHLIETWKVCSSVEDLPEIIESWLYGPL